LKGATLELSKLQQDILSHLKAYPDGCTSDHLASALGGSKTALRDHLVLLNSAQLVRFEDKRGIIGRPKRFYFLHSSHEQNIKKQYSWLSNILLEEMSETLSDEELKKVMEKLAVKVTTSLSSELDGLTKQERIYKVLGILNELGYSVKFKTDTSERESTSIIEANNCVFHSVAVKHPTLCQFDIRFIEAATGCSAKLQCCIARGAKVCRFSLDSSESR
jgi:predicted ArsR family transcriptional regulator